MITLSTAARNAAVNAITALLNSGTIEIQTSGDVEVATLTFGSTAFAAASSGTATANAITSDISATGGTGAKVVFKSSGAATILSGTFGVTGGGADVTAASVVISVGETVAMTSLTMTQPAS